MKIGVGARPMGMGKAFVAVADDGDSVFVNPAGLAGMKDWEFTSMYVNMMEGDVPYTVLSGAIPLKNGNNLGMGLIATGTSGIPSPGSQTITYFDYYDRLFFLSLAGSARKNLQLGGNLKMFSKGFAGGDNNSGFGVDADLGVKYIHNRWLTFGANLQNLAPFPLMWRSSAADDIPTYFKLGAAAKVIQEKLIVALDMDYPVGRSIPSVFHLGTEWPVTPIFALRAGADQIISASNNVATNPTAGVGLNFNGFRIDYAYHPYQESSTDIAHYVSFSYSPPPKQPIIAYIKILEPRDKLITGDESVHVTGRVLMPEVASVSVMNQSPQIGKNRGFDCSVRLLPKKNSIWVKAFNKKGGRLEMLRLRVLKLNSYPDVPPGYWAELPINCISTLGMIKGYPDGQFGPEGNITRAELAALLMRVKGEPPRSYERKFDDVSLSHWASAYINEAVNNGVAKGFPDGTFKPNDNVTRAEGLAMIARFAGIAPEVPAIHSDVPKEHWISSILGGALKAGMLQFLAGKPFEPNQKLTRAEAVELLYRAPKINNGVVKQLLDFEKGY